MTLAPLVAGALLAAAPVASAPGLVVSQGGRVYVEGVQVAKGMQPVWSRDGASLAYFRAGSLYVARADGSGERRLTRQGTRAWPGNSPSWSADGTRIAFAGVQDIYTVTLAGRLTRLTTSQKPWIGNVTPAYSPDGRTIAFARSTDAFNSDIFTMTSSGRKLRRVTTSVGTDTHLGEEHGPSWSPDGRTLVFVSNRSGKGLELYTIGANGKGERRLTSSFSPRYDEDAPRFSRDGTRIFYAHDGRIAVMNADGTGVKELGLGTSADVRP